MKKIAIITQTKWVQSQIIFYMHEQCMVPDHDAQYEENPSSHHGGMHNDGLTDKQMD